MVLQLPTAVITSAASADNHAVQKRGERHHTQKRRQVPGVRRALSQEGPMLTAGAAAGGAEVLALLGRAVTAMTGARDAMDAALGPGVDAAAAEQAYRG